MNNVYRLVSLFYEKREKTTAIVRRERIDRYFRSLAWQGKPDAILKRIWGAVSSLLEFMGEWKIYSFFLLTKNDFVEVFFRYAEARPNFRMIEKNVLMFLGYLEDFIKKCVKDPDDLVLTLEDVRRAFYVDAKFTIPDRHEYNELTDALEHADELTGEEADKLNDILDGLVVRMGDYFRREKFSRDFTRALTLFGGPYRDASLEGGDDFWYGFWDYFFFDYHMISDDLSPIRYFYEHEKPGLTAGERYVLSDLMESKFTVFRIDAIDDDFAICTDIFTGEQMDLPCPDHIFMDYRKMILYGHLHQHGVIMLNYITIIPATSRLRQRIKDEILRQLEIFRVWQCPEARLSDFLSRHSAAARHTIHILSNFAQLKVVPAVEIEPEERDIHLTSDMARTEELMEKAAAALGFSVYSISIAKRLYEDYASRAPGDVDDSVPAAVLLLIENINLTDFAEPERIVKAFGTTKDDVLRKMSIIAKTTGCVKLDPRYMTEEGYVETLYTL